MGKKEDILKGVIIIFTVINLFSIFLSGNEVVVAADSGIKGAAQDLAGGSPVKSPEDIYRILAGIVKVTYTIFFIIAVLFILLAAFSFLTAQGDPEKIISARNQIIWAVVAIAIALLSVGANQIIQNFLKKP